MIPVLLLPGLMNDARVWQTVSEAFGSDRTVVIAATHTAIGVEVIAANAIAQMPAGPFAVAGFSLGGFVASEVCRQVRHRVAGVALLGTNARAETEEGRQKRQQMIDAVHSGTGNFRAVAELFLPRVLHPAHRHNEELLSLLTDMAREVGAEGFVRQQLTSMQRPDSLESLRELRIPALVLCGQEDQIAPESLSREMSRAIENAQLIVVPDAGHMVSLEQPKAVSGALQQWLAQVEAAHTNAA